MKRLLLTASIFVFSFGTAFAADTDTLHKNNLGEMCVELSIAKKWMDINGYVLKETLKTQKTTYVYMAAERTMVIYEDYTVHTTGQMIKIGCQRGY